MEGVSWKSNFDEFWRCVESVTTSHSCSYAIGRRDREEEEVVLGRCWCMSMNRTFRTVLTRLCKRGEA